MNHLTKINSYIYIGKIYYIDREDGQQNFAQAEGCR